MVSYWLHHFIFLCNIKQTTPSGWSSIHLNGQLTQKWKFFQHLLTLISFQTLTFLKNVFFVKTIRVSGIQGNIGHHWLALYGQKCISFIILFTFSLASFYSQFMDAFFLHVFCVSLPSEFSGGPAHNAGFVLGPWWPEPGRHQQLRSQGLWTRGGSTEVSPSYTISLSLLVAFCRIA